MQRIGIAHTETEKENSVEFDLSDAACRRGRERGNKHICFRKGDDFMAKKKQASQDFKGVFFRLPIDQYYMLDAACDNLDITKAEFIIEALNAEGCLHLLDLANRINHQPREVQVDFSDKDAGKKIDALIDSMNEFASQMKRIGVNTGYIIRDLRSGKVKCDDPKVLRLLTNINNMIQQLSVQYSTDARRVNDALFTDKNIQKTEKVYVYKARKEEDDDGYMDKVNDVYSQGSSVSYD